VAVDGRGWCVDKTVIRHQRLYLTEALYYDTYGYLLHKPLTHAFDEPVFASVELLNTWRIAVKPQVVESLGWWCGAFAHNGAS
jgi:hypothetical protein